MYDPERLFELAVDLLCVAGVDGYFKRVNPAFTRLLGFSAEELTSRPLLDFVVPEDRAQTLAAIEKLQHGEKVLRFENRYLCKDGSHRWLAWTSVPDAQSGLVYAVARDTTAIKQSLEDLLRNLPGMAYRCALDADWTMRFVSDGCFKLTGYAPADLIGNRTVSYGSLVHADDRERVWNAVQEAIAARQEFEVEYRIRTADGDERVVWEQGHAIRIGDGEVFAIEGFITDITDRRRMQAEINQLQRMDSLGQLTGGIAHDFNNLLAVVIGNLDLLSEQLATFPQAAELIGDAADAAARGVELSRRLLAFARQQPLAPEVVSVNDLITGMRSMLRRSIGAAIEVRTALAEALPNVVVDLRQLENAILNLAINARDAMPDGGTLLIRTEQFKADRQYAASRPDVETGKYVMIEVADTGTGMSPEVRERVFEPFFTTKEPGRGTGLGLSMVYGFLKQSGGHARVYSELGHGTSVKLYLPESAEEQRTQTVETVKILHDVRGHAERILVVEDDAAVRRMVVRSLRELGYETLEAASAPRGLEILRERRDVDLLFSDVVMPGGMSGIELAHAAREVDEGLRILLTSGFSEQQIQSNDGIALLSKPYRKVQLAQAIRRALGARAAGGGNP